jgi:hypothetical protein
MASCSSSDSTTANTCSLEYQSNPGVNTFLDKHKGISTRTIASALVANLGQIKSQGSPNLCPEWSMEFITANRVISEAQDGDHITLIALMSEYDGKPLGKPIWQLKWKKMEAFECAIKVIKARVQEYEAIEKLQEALPTGAVRFHENPEINSYLEGNEGCLLCHLYTPTSTNHLFTNSATQRIRQLRASKLELEVRYR